MNSQQVNQGVANSVFLSFGAFVVPIPDVPGDADGIKAQDECDMCMEEYVSEVCRRFPRLWMLSDSFIEGAFEHGFIDELVVTTEGFSGHDMVEIEHAYNFMGMCFENGYLPVLPGPDALFAQVLSVITADREAKRDRKRFKNRTKRARRAAKILKQREQVSKALEPEEEWKPPLWEEVQEEKFELPLPVDKAVRMWKAVFRKRMEPERRLLRAAARSLKRDRRHRVFPELPQGDGMEPVEENPALKYMRVVEKPVAVQYQGPARKAKAKPDLETDRFFGITAHQRRRIERDERQRQAAEERAVRECKRIPKSVRERMISAARDKRVPVEYHGNKHLSTAVAVLGGAALAKLLGLIGNVNRVVNKSGEIVNCISDMARELKKVVGPMLWVVPLTCFVLYLLKKTNFSEMAVGVIVAALGCVLGPKLWAKLSKFFPVGELSQNKTYQVGSSDLSKLAAAAMTVSVFKKDGPSDRAQGEFLRRIKDFDRSSEGIESFGKWIARVIEDMINWLRERFGKERLELFKKGENPVDKWTKEVDSIACKLETAKIDVDSGVLDTLVRLVHEGYGFKEMYRNTSAYRAIDAYCIKAVNLLHPNLGALNARNNFRVEPIACMLLGAPGIGKTRMAMPFCSTVLLESGCLPADSTFEQVCSNIWQKGNSEFWNSYGQQACVVMDDAWQQRADATDKDSEYMNFIRMIGSWSFPLNFADLNSKGKIFFGSKLVFGTTNVSSIASEAGIVLNEPAAVVRRVTFPYELRIKDEYAKDSMLDNDKFEAELAKCVEHGVGRDRFPWYIWEVRRHDFLRGTPAGAWMPITDLLTEMASNLRNRLKNHADQSNYLKGYIEGVAGKMEPVPQGPIKVTLTIDGDDVKVALKEKPDINMWKVLATPPTEFGRFWKEGFHKWNVRHEARRERWYGQWMAKYVMPWVELYAVSYVTGFMFGIALGLIFKTVRGLICRFFGKKEVEPQSNTKVQVASKKPVVTAEYQGPDETVALNVYDNTYKMVVRPDDGANIYGQVLFLNGQLAVMPKHYFTAMQRDVNNGDIKLDDRVSFRHATNERHSFEVSVRLFMSLRRKEYPEKDLAFVLFKNESFDIRGHRNIIKCVVKESDIKHLHGSRARLDICTVDRNGKLVAHSRQTHFPQSLSYREKLPFPDVRIDRVFAYNAATEVGQCGAPLCMFDNRNFSGRTLIGMHIAGEKGRSVGYSTIITRELVDAAMKEFDVVVDDIEKDLTDRGINYESCRQLPFAEQGSFLPLFKLEKGVVICPKTSFYQTSLYGSLGEYAYKPAVMSRVWRDGVLVSPMENAVKPYSSPLLCYEQSWLEQAMHVAMVPLTSITKDYSRRLYTFEEAVLGVPEEKFRSIPRGTASGFPYVLTHHGGKKDFFGEGESYDLSGEHCLELKDRVAYVLSKAREGVRLSHIFIDFLKDELRSEAKVEAVATRLISSAPLDYTIAWRMMFGAFSSAVMRNHTVTGMAPGICAYTDWSVLRDRLSLHGEKVFDGDFKGFDSSEQPGVHRLMLDYINRWYDDGPDNAKAREVLWADLVHSRHVGGLGVDQTYVYQWSKSLPSGHPFTTIVNSMYSLFLLVGAYISITGDLTGFWTKVSAVTYGDDNVSNPCDDVSEKYNQRTVAEALSKEFSVTYTPGDKTNVFQETTTIDKVTFLKRRIVTEGSITLAPLELDSFLYTCYWCKNKRLEQTILRSNLETALEELSLHEADVWDKYSGKLAEMLQDLGFVTKALCTRKAYRDVVLSRSDNWY